MPLITEKDFLASESLPPKERLKLTFSEPETEPEAEDSALAVADAAFRRHNLITNAIYNQHADRQRTDVEFDAVEAMKEMDRLDVGQAGIFADNQDELDQIIEQHDRERNYDEIISRNDLMGLTMSAAAGIFDPTIFIPVAGAAKKGFTGARILKSFGLTGGTAAGIVASQEAFLQKIQTSRDAETSIGAIATAGLLVGALGAVGGALARNDDLIYETTRRIMDDGDEPLIQLSRTEDAAGAAPTGWEARLDNYNYTRADEGIHKLDNRLGSILSLNNKFTRSPTTGNLLSPFAANRMVANDLFEHNFILPKNFRGEATGEAVETAMKKDQALRVQTGKKVRDLYLQFAGVDKGVFKQARAIAKGKFGDKTKSWQAFNEEVSTAMRNNDTHAIPEVQEAARVLRKDMDRLTKRLQELGILPEHLEVKTASSYLTRRYNTNRILQDRATNQVFKRKLSRYFLRADPELSQRGAEDLADETIDNILGLGENTLQMNELTALVSKGGTFTKERKLLIDDKEIEEFLINDATSIYNTYADQASSLIRFNEKLQSRGFTSGEDYIRELRNEFKVRSDAIKKEFDKKVADSLPEQHAAIKTKQEKALLKLAKEQADSEKMIRDSVAIILGQYQRASKIPGMDTGLQYLRKFQVLRLMGGVLLSSLPDIVGPIFRKGLPAVVRDGYLPLLRSINKSNLARDQLKDLNIGLELEMNSMLKAITDPDYRLGRIDTPVERVVDNLVQSFGKVTGMSYWNRFHRRLAGHVNSAAIIRSLEKFEKTGKLPDHEVTRLAHLGISKDDYALILDNWNRFGTKESGSFITNFHNWDKKAKDIFSAAVIRDTDSTILKPSKGDIPFSVQGSELGKTLFQFKSFAAASTNKLLMSGLQQRPAKMIQTMAWLIAAGAVTWIIKEKIRGRDPEVTVDKAIIEGISRSGLGGLFGDVMLGLNPWYNSSRYAGVKAEGVILGPSGNLIQEGYQGIADILDGDVTESDIKKIVRLMPYHNVFWLRLLLEKLGE
jgi:hypothetical protein